MRRLLLPLTAPIAAVLLLTGCPASGPGPSDTVREFLEAESSEERKTYFVQAEREEMEDDEQHSTTISGVEGEYEIVGHEIDGDEATVEVDPAEGDRNMTFHLRREEGAWKISMEATMSAMLEEAMGEASRGNAGE